MLNVQGVKEVGQCLNVHGHSKMCNNSRPTTEHHINGFPILFKYLYPNFEMSFLHISHIDQ